MKKLCKSFFFGLLIFFLSNISSLALSNDGNKKKQPFIPIQVHKKQIPNYIDFARITFKHNRTGQNLAKGTMIETVLPKEFSTVPNSAKPWVYWWWLKGNVTKGSITRELEALHEQGFGGVLLFDSRGYHDGYYTGNIPVPLNVKMDFMGPKWREMVKYALEEAERLGLKMSINSGQHWGVAPWPLGYGS